MALKLIKMQWNNMLPRFAIETWYSWWAKPWIHCESSSLYWDTLNVTKSLMFNAQRIQLNQHEIYEFSQSHTSTRNPFSCWHSIDWLNKTSMKLHWKLIQIFFSKSVRQVPRGDEISFQPFACFANRKINLRDFGSAITSERVEHDDFVLSL